MSLFDDASLVLTPNGYKASKLYSIKPTSGAGDMTVVRATTATRVNSAGLIESVAINVPRLDYPPLGGCPSILVEPARTNLLTYSNTFSDASWTKLNCSITANNTTSPDGSVNASKLTSNVTNNNFLFKAVTAANGIYTFSCFVKYFDTNTINISLTDFVLGQAFGTFNFTTGTFTSSGVSGGGAWTNTTTNVITLPNGWFKISITSQKNAGTVVNSRIDTFVNGTSVYIYGAQLEVGSTATSYIPTVASTVTRVADVISKTGVSSLIGQTEGTIFVDVNFEAESIAKYYLTLGTSSAFNIAISAKTNNKIGMEVFNTTGQVNASSTSTYTTNQRLKIAMTYKLNDFKLYVNGVLQATDTGGTVPATAAVILGSTTASLFQATDGINLASIFTTALSSGQCISLTTL